MRHLHNSASYTLQPPPTACVPHKCTNLVAAALYRAKVPVVCRSSTTPPAALLVPGLPCHTESKEYCCDASVSEDMKSSHLYPLRKHVESHAADQMWTAASTHAPFASSIADKLVEKHPHLNSNALSSSMLLGNASRARRRAAKPAWGTSSNPYSTLGKSGATTGT